ncbi:MAG: carbon-nitrogen hydrolase family protein [Bdellovibrionales bacterium]
MKNLRVGIAQITSIDDVDANLKMILDLLSAVNPGEVDVVFFPENCLYMRLKEGESVKGLQASDSAFQKIADWAKHSRCAVHLGSVPLVQGAQLYNASMWIDAQGQIQPSYTKTHLFDIELEGQRPIRESDVFAHGSGPRTLNVGEWRLGQSICYDVRFSELFHAYAEEGVEVILVPSAFLVKTGQAHWEILLRARAIESQCYIIASAQSGQHRSPRGQRETYGHSLIVDPWGQKILEILDSPKLQIAELALREIQKVRQQIPMKNHRRGPFRASRP